ncbi:MAG TPA: hypothetical protein VGM90_21600 [Kofleriaceae bacterium]|jgi:hypothetical protein
MKRLALASLLALAACSKKPSRQESPAENATAEPPRAAEVEATGPALATKVTLSVDPKGGYASSGTLDFAGPTVVFAVEQPDGGWTVDIVIYPTGTVVNCEKGFVSAPENSVAVRIYARDRFKEPTDHLDVTGSYFLFNPSKAVTSVQLDDGMVKGAIVKLTKISGTTVTGELSGTTASAAISGGSGTFTGLFCKTGNPPDEN